MRHAKSSWDSGALVDFDRPLADRGELAAARMARWVVDHDLVPDRIVSSAAQRARMTASVVAKTCRLEPEQVLYDHGLYSAGFGRWLTRLQAQTAERVLICGHNPALDNLVETLATERPSLTDSGKLMTTAAIAHLSCESGWNPIQPGTWTLHQLARPRELGW